MGLVCIEEKIQSGVAERDILQAAMLPKISEYVADENERDAILESLKNGQRNGLSGNKENQDNSR